MQKFKRMVPYTLIKGEITCTKGKVYQDSNTLYNRINSGYVLLKRKLGEGEMGKDLYKKVSIWELMFSFMKIGPSTFGGGYAMIPLISREVVERKRWLTEKDTVEIFTLAQSIPGAVAINASTLIGYRIGGISGAIAAMFGVLLPTFLIVLVLCMFFIEAHQHPILQSALQAIRASILALIVFAAIKVGRTALLDKLTFFTIIGTVLLLIFSPIHPIFIILGGGIFGILAVYIRDISGMYTNLEADDSIKYKYKDYYIGDGI
jgi:chromate transporter